MANILVIYYSSYGTTHALAEAISEGVTKSGSEVRVRRAAETAPAAVVANRQEWVDHLAATEGFGEPTHDDLRWCDGVLFGTPTRYGNVAAPLAVFLERTGPLWFAGELANKTGGGFVTSTTPHGGHEATLFPLFHTLMHWGAIIVPPGYVGENLMRAGNPYGVSATAGHDHPMKAQLSELERAAAVEYGIRFADITQQLAKGKA
jgi:NAD(P)H dehydrogenase (quinone)